MPSTLEWSDRPCPTDRQNGEGGRRDRREPAPDSAVRTARSSCEPTPPSSPSWSPSGRGRRCPCRRSGCREPSRRSAGTPCRRSSPTWGLPDGKAPGSTWGRRARRRWRSDRCTCDASSRSPCWSFADRWRWNGRNIPSLELAISRMIEENHLRCDRSRKKGDRASQDSSSELVQGMRRAPTQHWYISSARQTRHSYQTNQHPTSKLLISRLTHAQH